MATPNFSNPMLDAMNKNRTTTPVTSGINWGALFGGIGNALNKLNVSVPQNTSAPKPMGPNLSFGGGSFGNVLSNVLNTIQNPNISSPQSNQNPAQNNKTQTANIVKGKTNTIQAQGNQGGFNLAGNGGLTQDQMNQAFQATQGSQGGTPDSGLSADQLSQIMNQALAGQGKDPFNLQNQSPEFLQGLMSMINQGMTQNNQNYTDILNQARQANNIPQLQQQFADIGNLVNQQQASLQMGQQQLGNQPIPEGLIQGQQALLEQQGQTRLQNLIGQQNVVSQQLGLAQGNVGQNLQAQQLQNQQALGLAGLGVQAFSLPQQQQLLQAQANQAQAQAQFYQNLYGGLAGNGGSAISTGGIAPQFQSYTNGQALSQLPSYFQSATSQDANGTGYIVADRLPDAVKPFAGSIAGSLGIPLLNSNQAQGAEKIDSSLGAINILQGLANSALSSGVGGRLGDVAKSAINDIFQNNPILTQLNRARTTAIQEIQGLAGDAPGLRLNSGEITAAADNLPTASDNLETALAKINISKQMLENQRSKLYNIAGYKPSSSSQSSSTASDPLGIL